MKTYSITIIFMLFFATAGCSIESPVLYREKTVWKISAGQRGIGVVASGNGGAVPEHRIKTHARAG